MQTGYLCYKLSLFSRHRYKEGRVILEQALITESEGFPDPYSTQPTANHRYNNQNHYQE